MEGSLMGCFLHRRPQAVDMPHQGILLPFQQVPRKKVRAEWLCGIQKVRDAYPCMMKFNETIQKETK
jgi:hypothetical protein